MAINVSPGAPVRLVQTFTSSGNFVVPAGTNLIYASVEGAAGGGCGSRYVTDPNGGGGVIAAGWVQVVQGGTLAIVVGAGGAASPNPQSGNGSAGGTTELSGAISITGGQGGSYNGIRYSQAPSGSASFTGTSLPTVNPGASTLVRITSNVSQATGGAAGGRTGSRYGGGPTAGASGKVHIFL